MIHNKQAVGNALNYYFINIAHELMQNISNTNVNYFNVFLNTRNNNSMFLIPIIEQELMDVVDIFKSKKSCDCNGLSMKMIKKVSYLISKPLTNIFNTSFNSGIFPDEMKIAKVLPVFKTCKKTIFIFYFYFFLISILKKFLRNFVMKD